MSPRRTVPVLLIVVALCGCRANSSRVHAEMSDAKIESRLEGEIRHAETWDEVLGVVAEQLDWEHFHGMPRWGFSPVLRHDEAARQIQVPLSLPRTNWLMYAPFEITEVVNLHISQNGEVTALERGAWDSNSEFEASIDHRYDWPEFPEEHEKGWARSNYPIVLAEPGTVARHSLLFRTGDSGGVEDQYILYVIPGAATTERARVEFESKVPVESAEIIALGSRRPAEAGAYILHSSDKYRARRNWNVTRLHRVPEVESGYLIKLGARAMATVEVSIEPPEGVEIAGGSGS